MFHCGTSCRISKGSPTQYLIRHAFVFQTGLLPSGRDREEGLSLILRDVQRTDAGVYVCTASNGVGNSASAEINVSVKCE